MRLILILSSVLFLSACTTTPKKEERARPPLPTSPPAEPEESIDLLGLQRSLKMTRDPEDLGYKDRAFNTCRAGFGYSPTKNCRQQHLVVLHFRLQCRDSEGTVSEVVTHAELMPVTSDEVRWNIGKSEGFTQTDGEGFGQIVMVAPKSIRRDRVRLTVGEDFLTMSGGDIKRIILPRNWCD
jgi:hypothetical protein